jgi:hypothetical protein
MELYVINPFQSTTPHFPVIGMIPSYYSLLWNPQLYGLGYFQVKVAATQENVNLLKKGRFLVRQEDIHQESSLIYENAMVIRDVTIDYNADQGYIMTVEGKSIKDILSQRIIWDQYVCNNKQLPSVIYDLMQRNIVDPKGYVEGVISDLNDQKDDLREDMDQTEDDISTARADYNQAVADYGADSPEAAEAKAVLDNYITVYENQVKQMGDLTQRITYYRWSLASQEDRQIPYIDAGLIDFPTTPPRITAELRGENLGEWFEQICKENRFGWDMVLSDSIITFVFVIGGDKSSTVIFSPEFDNLKTSSYKDSTVGYMNAGIVFGEGDGFHRKVAAVGLSTGYSRYEAAIEADISTDVETGSISTNKYYDMLCQYGKSELINHMDQTSFSGELDTDGIFKIGVDFNMGDKVTVQNEVGISATTRLIEIIYSDEASGHKVTGVFEEWED